MRVGLRFVAEESLENETLVYDWFADSLVVSVRLGLELGDWTGLRRVVVSLEFACEGLDVASSEGF